MSECLHVHMLPLPLLSPVPAGVKDWLLVAAAVDCQSKGLTGWSCGLLHRVGKSGITQPWHGSLPVAQRWSQDNKTAEQ